MAETTERNRTASALWPLWGNIFLVLLIGWLIYFALSADMADVRTAAFGLAGVCALLLMLGFRYAIVGEAPRRTAVRGDDADTIDDDDDDEDTTDPYAYGRFEPDTEQQRERFGTGPQVREAIPAEVARRLDQLEAGLIRERAERGALANRLEDGLAAAGNPGAGGSETLADLVDDRLARALTEEAFAAQVLAIVGTGSDDLREMRATLDALKEARAQDRQTLGKLGKELAFAPAGGSSALDVERVVERAEAEVQRRISPLIDEVAAESRKTLVETRSELAALASSLARLDALHKDLAAQLGGHGPAAQGEGEDTDQPPAAPADVATLREALTTIIEQNRQIREQQEILSARFAPATQVRVEPGG